MFKFVLAGVAAIWGLNATAFELSVPNNAKLTNEIRSEAASYFFATGPFDGQDVPKVENQGRIVQQAWRLDGSNQSNLQILSPIKAQLESTGYDILFECSDNECGSFDFRFDIAVIDAPDMFVDLYNYRYLSASKPHAEGEKSYAAILVSRSDTTGYVQVAYSTPAGFAELLVETQTAPTPEVSKGVVTDLLERGHVVLKDLEFESSATDLESGPYTSLSDLARYLNKDSTRRVALVGHTDATGGSEANTTLSRLRAAAVLERLVNAYDVDRLQLEADGAGYLSPIASNLTAEGREANRRVEAVLVNTE